MNEKPNYYAIIPGNVRYDPELKDKAKLLYGEITALSNKEGYCYASNNYFAELYGVTTQTIINMINNLIKKGYLERTIIYKEGTKEVEKRYLKIIEGGTKNILTRGTQKIFMDNITSNNTTSINNKRKYIKEKYGTYGRVKLTTDEYLKLVNEFGEEFIKQQIELLDEYLQMNNNKNKYTDFNLVLRKSIREKWFQKNKKEGESSSFLDTMKKIYDKRTNNN